MLRRSFTDSISSESYKCKRLDNQREKLHGVSARHTGVFGFDQRKFSASTAVLVGGGGGNGEVSEGLVRKGIGKIHIIDHDTVDATNLNRQKFGECDLHKNKALRLARNLTNEGFMGTEIVGHAASFQRVISKYGRIEADVLVCCVDNDQARVAVAEYSLGSNTPAVFFAVSPDTTVGYVFIQENAGPCFGCLFPEAVGNNILPCPGTPAVKDILKVTAGIALYAIDTVLMDRRRNWNYREIHLSGFAPDSSRWIERREDCQLCTVRTGDHHGD